MRASEVLHEPPICGASGASEVLHEPPICGYTNPRFVVVNPIMLRALKPFTSTKADEKEVASKPADAPTTTTGDKPAVHKPPEDKETIAAARKKRLLTEAE